MLHDAQLSWRHYHFLIKDVELGSKVALLPDYYCKYIGYSLSFKNYCLWALLFRHLVIFIASHVARLFLALSQLRVGRLILKEVIT